MASSVTLQASGFCAAGNHFTLTASGDINFSAEWEVADFLSPMTNDEKRAFLKGLVRFASLTRTAAQMKTGLINGVAVSI